MNSMVLYVGCRKIGRSAVLVPLSVRIPQPDPAYDLESYRHLFPGTSCNCGPIIRPTHINGRPAILVNWLRNYANERPSSIMRALAPSIAQFLPIIDKAIADLEDEDEAVS